MKSQGNVTPNPVRSSVDWVVISALVCALAALGVIAWQFWQNHSAGGPVEVALTDLVGTGDPVLDGALDRALRIDLSQSPFLIVAAPNQVQTCKRTSAQVILQGTVSKAGQHYLVTLIASNCAPGPTARSDAAHGKVLAQAKEEVQRLDDLPNAIGVVAASMRKSLGESRASIRHLDKPLRVASLAALQADSEAYRLGLRGDWLGAVPRLQHSLELDPQFPLAWSDLAATYSNLKDTRKEHAALTKAYELRDTLPELQQLMISARYYSEVIGDAVKSIETYKTWTTLYPQSAQAYGNLARDYDSVGQANLGVAPAKRAVELRPGDAAAYENLALTQLHSGQLKEAQQTCELAMGKNLDGADIRHLLLLAMYAQNDAVGVATQLDWGRDRPDGLRLHVDEVLIALSKGQIHKAQELLTQLRAREYSPGLAAEYQSGLASIARALAEVGQTSASLELLGSLEAAKQDRNALVALAEDGEVPQLDAALQQLARDHGQETLWKLERLPEIRAAVLLAKREPQQAVSTLEPTLPFDGLTFGPAWLRGEAYVALGKAQLAQTEFRKITEHVYVDPLSSEYPLAVLASARAYLVQHQTDQARDQFERFFGLWKTADADSPVLQAARAEYDNSVPVEITLHP